MPLLFLPLAMSERAVPFLLGPLLVDAFAIVLFNVSGISDARTVVPERLLRRTTASRRFVVWGTVPIDSVAGGAVASVIGLRETNFVGAIDSTVCFLFLPISPFRSMRPAPALEADA